MVRALWAAITLLSGVMGGAVYPTGHVDDPSRAAAYGFAGAGGDAAKRAAMKCTAVVHELHPCCEVEVETP